MVETCQRLMKTALKRCGYYQKKFTLGEWNYIAHRISSQINSRVLNVSYQADNFIQITPSSMIFGLKKAEWPRDIDLDNRDENLFKNVQKLDKECLLLENAWYKSYYHSVRRWRKWTVRRTLDTDDCVMVLDRITPMGSPQLAIVSQVFSDRTYEVTYVKKEAKMDKNTFQITKSATKGTLNRPINQLAIICKKNECHNVSMEFVDIDQTKTDGRNYPFDIEDELLGEDETFNDENVERQNESELDNMIVSGQPVEVVDEITAEETNNEEIIDNVSAETEDIHEDPIVEDNIVEVEPEAVQELHEVQENHEDNPLGTPMESQHENKVDTVNTVQKQPTIVNIEDEATDDIKDLTAPETPANTPKPRGRPKKKKGKRKKMNW